MVARNPETKILPRKTQLLWRSQTVTSLSAQNLNDVVAAAVKELVVVVAAASIAVDKKNGSGPKDSKLFWLQGKKSRSTRTLIGSNYYFFQRWLFYFGAFAPTSLLEKPNIDCITEEKTSKNIGQKKIDFSTIAEKDEIKIEICQSPARDPSFWKYDKDLTLYVLFTRQQKCDGQPT